jgi:hypothetical protein
MDLVTTIPRDACLERVLEKFVLCTDLFLLVDGLEQLLTAAGAQLIDKVLHESCRI